MRFKSTFRNLLVGTFVLSLSASFSFAQIDPDNKVRKSAKEVTRIYKDWLSKDVKYIITPEEKKAFKTLSKH